MTEVTAPRIKQYQFTEDTLRQNIDLHGMSNLVTSLTDRTGQMQPDELTQTILACSLLTKMEYPD